MKIAKIFHFVVQFFISISQMGKWHYSTRSKEITVKVGIFVKTTTDGSQPHIPVSTSTNFPIVAKKKYSCVVSSERRKKSSQHAKLQSQATHCCRDSKTFE